MLKQYLCTMRYFIGEYLLIEPIKIKENNSLSKECGNRHFSCQKNWGGAGGRVCNPYPGFVIPIQSPSTCINSQTRGWIFVHVFPAWLRPLVSNKLSHNCLLQDPFHWVWVSCVVSLVALVCLMPSRNKFILEQTKAFLTEQQRVRTERRLAQLRLDQRQLELSEVLHLLSLIWLIGIVLFYARLYLGPQE